MTTAARMFPHQFAVVQIIVFFSFYAIAGLALLIGAVLYASRKFQAN